MGRVTPLSDVLFPFEPDLRERDSDLSGVAVTRIDAIGPLIEEQYALGHDGVVEVTIKALETGFERVYRLGA